MDFDHILLRLVQRGPISHVIPTLLACFMQRMAAERKRVLVLTGENASWHSSREGCTWMRVHNQRAQQEGGMRLLPCRLPLKNPSLGPIAPYWLDHTRVIAEPTRLLNMVEIISSTSDYFSSTSDYFFAVEPHTTSTTHRVNLH